MDWIDAESDGSKESTVFIRALSPLARAVCPIDTRPQSPSLINRHTWEISFFLSASPSSSCINLKSFPNLTLDFLRRMYSSRASRPSFSHQVITPRRMSLFSSSSPPRVLSSTDFSNLALSRFHAFAKAPVRNVNVDVSAIFRLV